MHRRELRRFDQPSQIGDVLLQAALRRLPLALAVTTAIVGDHAKRVGERWNDGIPVVMIAPRAVDEYDGREVHYNSPHMSAPWEPADSDSGRCPIVVFCGKGGVGKTTLSLALGLAYARRGKCVVVVSSQPLSDLALTVSLDPLWRELGASAANLLVTYVDAREVLAALVEQQFPSPLLARSVLNSRLYRNLVEVAPGLKELAFLSRVRELSETRSQASGAIDALIWDAPATGHFLGTLKAPWTFDTYLSGPFAGTSRELQRFLTRRANLRIVPVTTLEEMAVQETVELWHALTGDVMIRPAGVACNLVSPMLQAYERDDREPDALAGLSPQESSDLAFVLDRHRIERDNVARLRSSLPGPFRFIRREPGASSDVGLLEAVSAQMTDATDGQP